MRSPSVVSISLARPASASSAVFGALGGAVAGTVAVVFVLVPLFTPAPRRAEGRTAPPVAPLAPAPLLASTVFALAAVASWRRARSSEAAGRSQEAALYRDQARWRARLAAGRRAADADADAPHAKGRG